MSKQHTHLLLLAMLMSTLVGCGGSSGSGDPERGTVYSPAIDRPSYERLVSESQPEEGVVLIVPLGLRAAGELWLLDFAAGARSSDAAREAADEYRAYAVSDPRCIGIATADGRDLVKMPVITEPPPGLWIHPPRTLAELLVEGDGVVWYLVSAALRTRTLPEAGTYRVSLGERNLSLARPVLDGWTVSFPPPTTLLVVAAAADDGE